VIAVEQIEGVRRVRAEFSELRGSIGGGDRHIRCGWIVAGVIEAQRELLQGPQDEPAAGEASEAS
jgi:hypothetical protein